MYLRYAIPVSLGLTAIFSIFMLQMGSDDETSIFLPLFALFAIPAGIWLCDIKKRFTLSEGWVNVLILLAVVLHLGTLLQSASAFLAYSIANILVWVQLILFFRKKEVMTNYHLLILSFIEGGVACVFQQSPLFAPVLLAFLLSVLCSISFLFLNQERRYYRTHAFLKPAFGAGEKVKRQTIGHLLLLALKTLFAVPLMILWGYRWKEFFDEEQEEGEFIIHRHETVPALKSAAGEHRLDPFFGVWQRGGTARTELAAGDSGRWPLFRTPPLFSGAIRSDENDRVRRSLLSRLLIGAFWSLLAAGIIFLFIPRVSDLEFGSVQLGHDQWQGARPAVQSVTGFSEQMKLGEMGPAINNHEAVLRIRFVDMENENVPAVRAGEPVYLRGTMLVRYEDRQWFRPETGSVVWRTFTYRSFPRSRLEARQWNEYPDKRPGRLFFNIPKEYERGRFDPRNALVREEMTLYPLSSPVIFTVWPFFQIERGTGILQGERYIRASSQAVKEQSYEFCTSAFRDGAQVELTPAQETLSEETLRPYLQIDRDLLPKLCALAAEWDAESGLPKEDFIGRAKYLERKLRNTDNFQYSRVGVDRNENVDPLEDFVTEHPEGHCEYFAGVLAMMLRAVEIPSRIIGGFCFVQEENAPAETTVRQSDAHVWVEAFIPKESLPANTVYPRKPKNGKARTDAETAAVNNLEFWWADGGWLRLDATPERGEELFDSFNIGWQSLSDILTHFWNTYVLNFSGSQQRDAVYRPVGAVLSRLWESLKEAADRLNPFGDSTEGNADSSTAGSSGAGRWAAFLRMAGFLLAGIGVIWGVVRLGRYWRRGAQGAERTGSKARELASGFFSRLERWLTSVGLARKPAETPREYIRRALASPNVAALCANDSPLAPDLFDSAARSIVEIYYRVRFGRGAVQPDEKERIDDFLKKLPRAEKRAIPPKERAAANEK